MTEPLILKTAKHGDLDYKHYIPGFEWCTTYETYSKWKRKDPIYSTSNMLSTFRPQQAFQIQYEDEEDAAEYLATRFLADDGTPTSEKEAFQQLLDKIHKQ